MKKLGVVRFPGTNCDRDVFEMGEAQGFRPEYLWHLNQFNISDYDLLVLPGGFSYGDYLRAGALSARSPVMSSVREFAGCGGPVLGICNGFQVLVESGLLPGALVKNESLRFIDDWATLHIQNASPMFAKTLEGQTFRLPIAHGEGRFYAPADEIKKIEDAGQVWMTYEGLNPNGSLRNIAGVLSEKKNVAGLMPHPERALYSWMGGTDGSEFLV